MINIRDITWGAPAYSSCFFVAIIVFCLLFYKYKKQQKAYDILVGQHWQLLSHFNAKKQWLQYVLIGVGFLFLCVALLRPQWNKLEETITQSGRNLYIALDISRSMLASDCKPNRLVCAKEKIKKLVKNLSCERVGLILFSGSAFVQCPLTSDYAAFYLYLDAVDAELISSGTTALDQAINQAILSFSAMPECKSKLLMIFTDGEDFSHNLYDIKKQAIDAQLSIFTMGIGTREGAPVPVFNAEGTIIGHQKDEQGAVVISRLNEEILSSISHDVGGSYICMTDNDNDIGSFVRAIESFEKDHLDDRKILRNEDQYHYCLLISFICFALEWLL